MYNMNLKHVTAPENNEVFKRKKEKLRNIKIPLPHNHKSLSKVIGDN